MNEQNDFERLVADQLANAGVGMPPGSAIEDTIARAGGTRRLPQWLALIKEPPMRTNSHLAVGSPTVRVAAILAATLLLAVALAAAGVAGQRLLAANGPIVVAQDGSGDFTTLSEAVAAAADGDEILVRPGTYDESVVVDKDVAIRGDGPREDIVISGHQDPDLWAPGSECETSEPGACAIVLRHSDTALSDITLSGPHSGLKIIGGAPVVSGVLFDHVGNAGTDTSLDAGLALYVIEGSAARIVGNEFVASADLNIHGRSAPLIEGNSLRDGSRIMADDPGDGTTIRANEISDAVPIAINVNAATHMLIEDNVITGSGQDAIQLGLFSAIGIEPIIRGNTISGSGGSGINGVMGGAPTIEDNTFSGNATGLLLGLGQAQVLENEFTGDGTGITLARGSDPTLTGNTIDVSGVGIVLGDGAKGTLTDNEVCGAETAISTHENAETSVDGSNVVCDVRG